MAERQRNANAGSVSRLQNFGCTAEFLLEHPRGVAHGVDKKVRKVGQALAPTSPLTTMSTPQPIPDVQKAWVSVRKGSPARSLELRKDWPVKKPLAPGEVLVKVHAAALNPVFVFFSCSYDACADLR